MSGAVPIAEGDAVNTDVVVYRLKQVEEEASEHGRRLAAVEKGLADGAGKLDRLLDGQATMLRVFWKIVVPIGVTVSAAVIVAMVFVVLKQIGK